MRVLLLAVGLIAPVSTFAAQATLVTRTLDSATVVRFHLVRGDVVQGVLLAPLGPDATAIAFAPPPHRPCAVPRAVCRFEVPVAEVRAVEIPRGSHVGRGALIGAGIGAVLGLMLGLEAADSAPCLTSPGGGCGRHPSDAAVISVTTLLGTALGASIGALFGWGSTDWGPAP